MLGRKLGMTQVFDAEDGHVERVTVIEAGPCFVTAIRRADRDGYDAVQLAFGEITREEAPEGAPRPPRARRAWATCATSASSAARPASSRWATR